MTPLSKFLKRPPPIIAPMLILGELLSEPMPDGLNPSKRPAYIHPGAASGPTRKCQLTGKKTTKKRVKRSQQTVIVIQQDIDAKDTLFPAKVARANKILSNTKFHEPGLNR